MLAAIEPKVNPSARQTTPGIHPHYVPDAPLGRKKPGRKGVVEDPQRVGDDGPDVSVDERRGGAQTKGRVLFEGTLDLAAEMAEPLAQGPVTVQPYTQGALAFQIQSTRDIQSCARVHSAQIVEC